MTDIVCTDNLDNTATVTWTTDVQARGLVIYGPVCLTFTTAGQTPLEDTLTTSHSRTFGITTGTNYTIVLVNNACGWTRCFGPSTWAIATHCNRDCKVNILDLIFVRNRLNQLASAGDNIFGDVNTPAPDGKINILDLIQVRNHLNEACPGICD